MKKRLEKDAEIARFIRFSEIKWKGCLSFWFIFSTNLPFEKAVAASYLLATKDHLHDTATYLRESNLITFRESKEMARPPTLKYVKQIRIKTLSLSCFQW